ncbi:MAG: alpha/beta hydrolase [Burkholderiaceae bacterium]
MPVPNEGSITPGPDMFIRNDDAELHARVFGHGTRSILAIGGWVGPGEVWHDCFSHLAGWRCASFDHRGTGASAHARDPITSDAMVDDLLAVADTLALPNCVLAAESAGAGVALRAVRLAPERFGGLVLVGAAWRAMPSQAMDAMIGAMRADYDRFLAGFVAQCLPETKDPALHRWALRLLRQAAPAHAEQLMRCRNDESPAEELERIGLRTLVVHGTDDRIVPFEDSVELCRRLPAASLHQLDGLGHAPMVSAPARIAALIDAHFAATPESTTEAGSTSQSLGRARC